MSSRTPSLSLSVPILDSGRTSIAAPSAAFYVSQFGKHLPVAQFFTSAWGTTAFYDFPPASSEEAQPRPHAEIRRVLFIHGVGTPAFGLLPLASKLRAANPSAHFVLYDLWGHGLSSTPLSPHVPALFHSQIIQLLGHLEWPSAQLIGFSFGGSTAVSFAAYHPKHVESIALVAPVGLLRFDDFSAEMKECLKGEDEEAARKTVFGWLGAEPPCVPEGWNESFQRGEIIAPALWAWEIKEHEGHVASIVSMIRHGGVTNQHKVFKRVAEMGLQTLTVLGDLDDVCTVQDLAQVGFSNVSVVAGANHEVVREYVSAVADLIDGFWKSLA